MKKNNFFTGLFFVTALACFSFDGGGLIKTGFSLNTTSQKKQNTILNIKNFDGVSLWAEQNMDKEGLYNFSIQGSYLFKYSQILMPKKENPELKHILDLDMLKFSFLFPLQKSSMLFEFGRYGLEDSTGCIFNQMLDGLFFSYESFKFSTHFSFGYTGLLNFYTAAINSPVYKKKTKIYSLAPGFIGLNSLFHIPLGKHRYALDIELSSFIQPKGKTKKTADTKKGVLSKNYLAVSANGLIASNLYFILSAIGELRTENGKVACGLAMMADAAYYFSEKSAKLGFKMQWFSGGKNYFDPFILINTSKTLFILNRNLWKNNLYATVKPVPELSLGTDISVFCAGKKIKGESFYKGFEFALSANYIILQDISLGLDTGIFVDDENMVEGVVAIKGVISF